MDIFKPGNRDPVYSGEELDRACETLMAAQEIKENDKFYQLCLKHMEEKKGKITKIQDLRDAANKPEGDSERKNL